MSRAVKLQDSMAYPPRAMKADRAAAYLDMSRSKFLELGSELINFSASIIRS